MPPLNHGTFHKRQKAMRLCGSSVKSKSNANAMGSPRVQGKTERLAVVCQVARTRPEHVHTLKKVARYPCSLLVLRHSYNVSQMCTATCSASADASTHIQTSTMVSALQVDSGSASLNDTNDTLCLQRWWPWLPGNSDGGNINLLI